MEKNKKFKVTVERVHTTVSFYEIEASSDDSAEFHELMHQCTSGVAAALKVDTGAQQGHVRYEELNPVLSEVKAEEAAPGEVNPAEPLGEVLDVEDTSQESFVCDLEDKLTLHVCPHSGIPFLGEEVEAGVPYIPFESTTSVQARDDLIEGGQWAQDDVIVYMEWLDVWVNICKKEPRNKHLTTHWTAVCNATKDEAIHEALSASEE
jgi:hypothetical protein